MWYQKAGNDHSVICTCFLPHKHCFGTLNISVEFILPMLSTSRLYIVPLSGFTDGMKYVTCIGLQVPCVAEKYKQK